MEARTIIVENQVSVNFDDESHSIVLGESTEMVEPVVPDVLGFVVHSFVRCGRVGLRGTYLPELVVTSRDGACTSRAAAVVLSMRHNGVRRYPSASGCERLGDRAADSATVVVAWQMRAAVGMVVLFPGIPACIQQCAGIGAGCALECTGSDAREHIGSLGALFIKVQQVWDWACTL